MNQFWRLKKIYYLKQGIYKQINYSFPFVTYKLYHGFIFGFQLVKSGLNIKDPLTFIFGLSVFRIFSFWTVTMESLWGMFDDPSWPAGNDKEGFESVRQCFDFSSCNLDFPRH